MTYYFSERKSHFSDGSQSSNSKSKLAIIFLPTTDGNRFFSFLSRTLEYPLYILPLSVNFILLLFQRSLKND